jgi:carbon storage regulator
VLVLARKKDESIMIGDDIEIIVVDIKGDQVKLGIKAPKNVAVHRTEVYKEIQEQNRQAAVSSVDKLKELDEIFRKKKNSDKENP